MVAARSGFPFWRREPQVDDGIATRCAIHRYADHNTPFLADK
jgi:hypothetical protein